MNFLLVAKNSMKIEDGLFFILRKLASLDIWPKIISQPQPATLSTSIKTCSMFQQLNNVQSYEKK